MLRKSSLRIAFILLTGAAALCPASAPLLAQVPQNMDEIVDHIAATVDLVRPHKVLIAPLDGCLLDQQICDVFEEGVKARLENMLPSVRFVEREELIAIAMKLGFLAPDVYVNGVLGKAASETAADIRVTETLKWDTNSYGLVAEVFDVKNKDDSLIRLELKIPRSIPDAEEGPLVVEDPDSGLSMLVRKGEIPSSSVVQSPRCTYCPDPKYTEAARKKKTQGTVQLVLTITKEGVPQDISLAKSLEPTLDAPAIESARKWRFKPGTGSDGKPLTLRTHAEVTFRLL